MRDLHPPSLARWLALGIVCAALLMRTAFLTADPPQLKLSGIWWVEELGWTHNAQSKALFGIWQLDHFNPMHASPTFTAAVYLAFASLGVGTWQARLPSVVAGAGVLIFFYLLLARVHGRRIGLAGLALAGTDYMLVMYSRVVLVEMLLLLFMVVCAYCYVRGRDSRGFSLAAGVAAGAVVVTKAVGAFFIGVPVVTSLWLFARASATEEKRREARRLAACLAGLLLVLTAWLGFWIVPNWDLVMKEHLVLTESRFPRSMDRMLFQVLLFPLAHPVFARMLPVTIIGLLVAWVTLRDHGWNGSPVSDFHAFFLVWLGLGTITILASDFYHQRRYVMLVPPLIGLAVSWLAQKNRPSGTFAKPSDRSWVERLILGGVSFYGLYWIFGAVSRAVVFDLESSWLRYRHLAAGALVAAAACWLAASLPKFRAAARLNDLLRPKVVALVFALAVVTNLWQYADWARTRSYTVLETSRSLASLIPPSTYVLGDMAALLTWENSIRPLVVDAPYSPPIDPGQRAAARFILVRGNDPDQAPEVRQLLAEAFPGPPLREFVLYARVSPGEPERVLLFRRKIGEGQE